MLFFNMVGLTVALAINIVLQPLCASSSPLAWKGVAGDGAELRVVPRDSSRESKDLGMWRHFLEHGSFRRIPDAGLPILVAI
jgi:hypothetical protein